MAKRKSRRRKQRRIKSSGNTGDSEQAGRSETDEEEAGPSSQKRVKAGEADSAVQSNTGHSSTQDAGEGPSSSQEEQRTPQKGQGEDTKATMKCWRERVEEWYPHYEEDTYFVPSVFMNRMHLEQTEAAGQGVLVIQPPATEGKVRGILDKDVREDRSHQTVIDCLQRLKNEAMFVISQLQFGNYLGEPAYAAAAENFPKPSDLSPEPQKKDFPKPFDSMEPENNDQGDFDVLIIHRDYGILACEIKSVGGNFLELNLSSEKEDTILVKKIQDAIKQLKKYLVVLKHIARTHDGLVPRIKTTLMLPNITKVQLERALSRSETTRNDLCKQLGIDSTKDPIPLCLTKDDIENPESWWTNIMAGEGQDPVMQDPSGVYLDLISRFCGPATTVTVHCPSKIRLAVGTHSSLRSLGNGVAEVARRFAPSYIMLHPKQVDLLNERPLPLVYITGPPGTGKTVVLLVKAREWLKQNKPVLVLNTQPEGLAASHMIKTQLALLAGGNPKGNIELLSIDLTKGDYKDALSELQNRVQGGELYIIADEVSTGSTFRELCSDLQLSVGELHLWAASVFQGKGPACLREVELTEPLRTPPRVTREVKDSGYITQGEVLPYGATGGPLPTDGPPPITFLHSGDGHGEFSTIFDCKKCGERIAKKLSKLGFGHPGSSQDPRSYRHVFLLTEGDDLVQTQTDTQTNTETVVPRGLLVGLEESNIPYMLLRENDNNSIEEVATMSGPDKVVVAKSLTVCGLERPMVVWVQGDTESNEENKGRLNAVSRTTAQLIWVRNPTPGEV